MIDVALGFTLRSCGSFSLPGDQDWTRRVLHQTLGGPRHLIETASSLRGIESRLASTIVEASLGPMSGVDFTVRLAQGALPLWLLVDEIAFEFPAAGERQYSEAVQFSVFELALVGLQQLPRRVPA